MENMPVKKVIRTKMDQRTKVVIQSVYARLLCFFFLLFLLLLRLWNQRFDACAERERGDIISLSCSKTCPSPKWGCTQIVIETKMRPSERNRP